MRNFINNRPIYWYTHCSTLFPTHTNSTSTFIHIRINVYHPTTAQPLVRMNRACRFTRRLFNRQAYTGDTKVERSKANQSVHSQLCTALHCNWWLVCCTWRLCTHGFKMSNKFSTIIQICQWCVYVCVCTCKWCPKPIGVDGALKQRVRHFNILFAHTRCTCAQQSI